jgi:hypothetical protein
LQQRGTEGASRPEIQAAVPGSTQNPMTNILNTLIKDKLVVSAGRGSATRYYYAGQQPQ